MAFEVRAGHVWAVLVLNRGVSWARMPRDATCRPVLVACALMACGKDDRLAMEPNRAPDLAKWAQRIATWLA
jgi:hypothetical protein